MTKLESQREASQQYQNKTKMAINLARETDDTQRLSSLFPQVPSRRPVVVRP